MSRFALRDVSERLTKSRSIESVISEFLRSLEGMRSDWRASLAFYEVSRDALVDVYELDRGRLVRRNIVVPIDTLPHRLVRKIFENKALQNEAERVVVAQSALSSHYQADPRDASELMPLTVLTEWESCICLPLGYQDDLIAMLVLTSAKKNAFGGRALGEVVPLKSIATVALAQHLYRTARQQRPEPAAPPKPAATAPAPDQGRELREEALNLAEQSEELEREVETRSAEIQELMARIETLDKTSLNYKDELERVKQAVGQMEENSEAAVEYLTEAYDRLQATQWTLEELDHTVSTLRGAFEVLSHAIDSEAIAETMVDWFCESFQVDRCSLLVPDPMRETLVIAAQVGIDPAVAARVRVRFGQGVAGWVAAHHKPLYVRAHHDAQSIPRSGDGTYNSESFIVVPVLHNGALHGVLNLSNRQDCEGFSQAELDRALLAASAFAGALGGQQVSSRAAAWR